MGSLWAHSEVNSLLGSLEAHSGVGFTHEAHCWSKVGFTLVSLRGRFSLGSFEAHFGVSLGSLWARFEVASLRAHFRLTLESRQVHFGLTPRLLRFGFTLGSL